MDKVQEHGNGPAEDGSGQYLWLAGAFVGGFLILMIILIMGIILWRHIQKQNMSIDQNWAGPVPLADGNIQEEGNCINSSILGRSISLSHTTLITSNEHQTAQEVQGMWGPMQHEHCMEKEANEKTVTALKTPIVQATPTKNVNLAADAQISPQNTGNGLSDDTFPPPPPDLQEFPLPPEPTEEEVKDNHLQTFPETQSHQQDRNSNQEPFNLQVGDIDAPHITNMDDQHLPPPPPDL